MTKFHSNGPVFFVLLTAFLSMQWGTSHIHLAEQHDHDGSHHLHTIKAHSHYSITENDYSFSLHHPVDSHNDNVVEIDHQCNNHTTKSLNDQVVPLTTDYWRPNFIALQRVVIATELNNSEQRFIDYTTKHPRSPPKSS
ncbi:MAG: hypothetical protein OEY36_10925 [Gammaproteobacteria bacterium]|nr:hypothetical protein [Gammaproteobacteria bacterium]